MTATIFNGQGISTTQSVGAEASIMSAIGLALLAPALIRAVTATLAGVLKRLGASGYLTVVNVRQRTQQMSGALIPMILVTSISTGTLYMQSIENSTGIPMSSDDKGVATLNYVVVGMVCVFAAIMMVNSLIAATIYRRREFGQQRLAGSTPPQVLGMVSIEDALLLVTGLVFGTVSGLLTVVPYNIARTHSVMPNSSIGIYLGIAGTVVVLTLAAGIGAARRAIRTPAVEAVTA
jgi:putative ABC transport system permease protein